LSGKFAENAVAPIALFFCVYAVEVDGANRDIVSCAASAPKVA
jgi:hypothetical protein